MHWMWIDRVVELLPGRRLVAIKNVSLAEEHLHDHFAANPARGLHALPVMPASLILEGVAQSGGILVGHAEEFRHNVVLAKISRAELHRDATPGTTLRYTVDIERLDHAGASTRALIELFDHARPQAGFAPIGSAELIFSHLANNMGAAGSPGDDFPAHNFVFGDSFKNLLRNSGITIDA